MTFTFLTSKGGSNQRMTHLLLKRLFFEETVLGQNTYSADQWTDRGIFKLSQSCESDMVHQVLSGQFS